LIADVKSNTNGETVEAELTDVQVRATNGSTVVASGEDVLSSTHEIVENRVVVAKLANPNKAIATSALRFSVTAQGKDKVTLTALPLDLVSAGYT
jgi:hypothetical protein